MKTRLLLAIGMMVVVCGFFGFAYGHGVNSPIIGGPLRIEDETFSAQSVSTDNQSLSITGKLVSLVDYPQQLEMSMLVTTDQFQTLSASAIIHNLQYGIHRDYQEHDDWFFQTDADPDKITLKPRETAEYKITTVPLKAGTYHVHTQVTSDKGSKLGPGQTIIVNGSSDITMGELLGIYARFAALVLFVTAGIWVIKKIILKKMRMRK